MAGEGTPVTQEEDVDGSTLPPRIDGHKIVPSLPPPTPPDREEFQSGVSLINNNIALYSKRLNVLVGRNGTKSLIGEAVENRSRIRRQREELKEETDRIKKKIEEKIKLIDDLRCQMKQLEPELQWKSAERLEKEIKVLEEKYRTPMKNNREEKLVVSDLDRLKRNKKRLEKYNALLGERRELESDISVYKLQRDESFNQQRSLRREQIEEVKKREQLKEEARTCRQELEDMISERSTLMKEYQAARSSYSKWVHANKKAALKATSSFPATFPSAHRNNNDFPVEVDELEPFYEQKRDCRLLISYLERLEGQSEGLPSEHSTVVEDDSGDEFPEAFSRLQLPSRKKKGHHKKTTKVNQPLSHVFDIYKLFGQVQVDPPKYLSEVKECLEKVRQVLKQVESETVEMDWDEEQYGLGPSMSRTMSTVDSAFDQSETTSVNSGRLLFSPSPLGISRRDSQRFSRNDEGLGSHDSAGPSSLSH